MDLRTVGVIDENKRKITFSCGSFLKRTSTRCQSVLPTQEKLDTRKGEIRQEIIFFIPNLNLMSIVRLKGIYGLVKPQKNKK